MAGGVNVRCPRRTGLNAFRHCESYPCESGWRPVSRLANLPTKQTHEEDAMAAVTRFTLGFVLGIAGCAAVSSAEAATIAGTVTGPDGKGFRGAFVQAKNLKTKIMG